ncbi:hypothetical protein E6C60_3082 [Paenibacillus algicola]|uniref:Uncharacterized protein n=1 Tax=Paenibacillus algicola TaxID=2565926 RepID=A0A4P8XMX6_9BACL|nr:hypothetical protein [Paenibacillus algicola]QCT03793.1 hypothetical protein E6C60_3082 [Paenibacillus algicola]
MLPDLERKLLRILVNYSMHRRTMPPVKLIEYLTGRAKAEITQGLESLENREFITWADKGTTQGIKILREEEDEEPQLPAQDSNNLDYWTYY